MQNKCKFSFLEKWLQFVCNFNHSLLPPSLLEVQIRRVVSDQFDTFDQIEWKMAEKTKSPSVKTFWSHVQLAKKPTCLTERNNGYEPNLLKWQKNKSG